MAVDTWDGLTGHDPWDGLSGHERHAACLIAARSGNRRALDVLVTDLTPLVWHVTRGQGLDRVHAEDVVQTVWLALLRHLNRLEQPKALAAWLIVTARREAQRAKTAGFDRETTVPAEDLVDIPAQVDGPEQHALRDDRDRRLWAAFKQLSDRCQKLLTLTVLAGRAQYDAVAQAMEMPRGSIGPTRGRCLISLRELLDKEGGPR
jgi:RNA polymerase sigma factor (sigma-70 family)